MNGEAGGVSLAESDAPRVDQEGKKKIENAGRTKKESLRLAEGWHKEANATFPGSESRYHTEARQGHAEDQKESE